MRKITILFAIFITSLSSVFGQDENEMVSFASTNCAGIEYFLTIPPAYRPQESPNDFVSFYFYSDAAAKITLEVEGKEYSENLNLGAKEIAEIKITPEMAHVFQYDSLNDEKPEGVFKGAGIHITSDYPVLVYCKINYGQASEAFLVYPLGVYGRRYIASSYESPGSIEGNLPSFTGITAAFDNTVVKFTLGGNESTKTPDGITPGQSITKTLNRGDVWLIPTSGDYSDISGSAIEATRPVSVVSGVYCANVPTANPECNYLVEMETPDYAWGKKYLVGLLPDRENAPVMRAYAKEAGTKIYRNGAQFGQINKSGGKLGEGYLEFRLTASSQEIVRPMVIEGDKPIYLMFYNPGNEEESSSDVGAFCMTMPSVEQFSKEITFMPPSASGGGVGLYNWVNVYLELDDEGNIPDDVEYGELKFGKFSWSKLKQLFGGATDLFQVEVDGKRYGYKNFLAPNYGALKIRAETPIGANLFGFSGEYTNYGYPASHFIKDYSKGDTDAPVFDYEFLCEGCGSISGADVTDKPDNVTTRSNLRLLYMAKNESTNYIFNSQGFLPGVDESTKWSLEPVDSLKSAIASIVAIDRAGNSATEIIRYYSKYEVVSGLDVYDFGVIKRGKAEFPEMELEILNNSELFDFTMDTLFLVTGEAFSLKIQNFPQDISMGASLKTQIVFNTDIENGSYTDTLIIKDNGGQRKLAIIKAQIGEPEIMATNADFGDIGYKEENSVEFEIINNSGIAGLEIFGLEGEKSGAFLYDFDEPTKQNPVIVSANEGVKKIRVSITPEETGFFKDSLVFLSDAKIDENTDNISIITANVLAAKIEVEDVIFGKLNPGEKADRQLKIRNTGDWGLKITKIYFPSSSPFKFDFNENISASNPLEIKVGEEYAISVSLENNQGLEGQIEKTVSFVSNAINGEVQSKVIYDADIVSVYDILSNVKMYVYPSPAKDVINVGIESADATEVYIEIVSSGGAVLLRPFENARLNPGYNTFKIGLSGIPQGNYFLRVGAKNSSSVRKFSIVK